MAKKIFTRQAVNEIMGNEELTAEQRTEQVFALWGRALDDGYIDRAAAAQAQQTALDKAREDWEKGLQAPDIRQSEEYMKLQSEFDAYRAKQTARSSDDFKDVKPKFFDTVYDLLDRAEGAKPLQEQLAGLREGYEEYFIPAQPAKPPVFGAPTEGSMPKGEKGAKQAFSDVWGFAPKQ